MEGADHERGAERDDGRGDQGTSAHPGAQEGRDRAGAGDPDEDEGEPDAREDASRSRFSAAGPVEGHAHDGEKREGEDAEAAAEKGWITHQREHGAGEHDRADGGHPTAAADRGAAVLVGDEEPAERVDGHAGAAREDEQDEGEPEDQGVEAEVAPEPARDTTEHAVLLERASRRGGGAGTRGSQP